MKPHNVNSINHSFGLGGAGIPLKPSRPRWPADLPPCRNGATGLCAERGCKGCEARRVWLARRVGR